MSFALGLISYLATMAVGGWVVIQAQRWRARLWREQDPLYWEEHGENR